MASQSVNEHCYVIKFYTLLKNSGRFACRLRGLLFIKRHMLFQNELIALRKEEKQSKMSSIHADNSIDFHVCWLIMATMFCHIQGVILNHFVPLKKNVTGYY